MSVVVAIISGALGLFAFWQAWLRWRAHGTAEVRELTAEVRATFEDVIAHRGLYRSKVLTGDRRTVKTRMRDMREQLHNDELQGRIDHLLRQWDYVLRSCPLKLWEGEWWPYGGAPPIEPPTNKELIEFQLKSARNGCDEAESVLDSCNQLDRWVVRP